MADRKKNRRKFDEVNIFVIHPITFGIHRTKIFPAIMIAGYSISSVSGTH